MPVSSIGFSADRALYLLIRKGNGLEVPSQVQKSTGSAQRELESEGTRYLSLPKPGVATKAVCPKPFARTKKPFDLGVQRTDTVVQATTDPMAQDSRVSPFLLVTSDNGHRVSVSTGQILLKSTC